MIPSEARAAPIQNLTNKLNNISVIYCLWNTTDGERVEVHVASGGETVTTAAPSTGQFDSRPPRRLSASHSASQCCIK